MVSALFLKSRFGDATTPDGTKISDNFKNWFGGSHLVDDNGAPLVAYHGTVVDGTTYSTTRDRLPAGAFTVFDENKQGSMSETSDAKAGFWFSSSLERAQAAADDAHAGNDAQSRFVYEVFLRIENPLRKKNIRKYSPEDVASMAEKAREAGRDGIIFEKGEFGPPDYLVFSPLQIKSALANSGGFNPIDPDISDSAAWSPRLMPPAQCIEAFDAMTKTDFLGRPAITSGANGRNLRPSVLMSHEEVVPIPFVVPGFNRSLSAVYARTGAAVLDGHRVIASYHFGDHLVVSKPYRRQGIGRELVYQFRTRFPDVAPAKSRTRASQALQIRVWERIEKEARLLRACKKAVDYLAEPPTIFFKNLTN